MVLWPQIDRDWCVLEDSFESTGQVCAGSVFSLANGVLGVRGVVEEWSNAHGTIFVPAVLTTPLHYHERFVGFAESTDTRLLGPGVSGLGFAVDGQPVDPDAMRLTGREVVFDLRTATLHIRTSLEIAPGRTLEIETARFVPLGQGAIFAQQVSVTPVGFDGELAIDFPVAMAAVAHGEADDPRISARRQFQARTGEGRIGDGTAYFVAGEDGGLTLAVRQRLSSAQDVNLTGQSSASALRKAGEALVVDRLVALSLGEGADDDYTLQSGQTLDQLYRDHGAQCDAFWQTARLELPAVPDLGLALRFNLLQIFLSASRDAALGTAAKGLSGEGYEGHTFWDSDVFLLPVLALIAPELARKAIEFRIGTLDRALANARAIGHQAGALYPWRTIHGAECSAHYPTGSAQYHINAGIAYGLEVYLRASGDQSIMETGGYEMLVETARLWLDVGHFSERRNGAFLIHGVTGPDEYTALVDNDFYTNAMARRHLLFAAEQVGQLAANDPAGFRSLAAALSLSGDEIDTWRRAGERMWLPIDERTGVHPQDDTFLDKPLFPAHSKVEGDHQPLLLRVHPLVLFRHRLTKQGDVIQAHVTGGLDSGFRQVERDLTYYEPLTTHDSTLSMTAFAICASWQGDNARALDYWNRTTFVDLRNLHGNSHHGLHMAAMAGSWLVLALGWAGLRFEDDNLRLAPRHCTAVGDYALRLKWRGSVIDIRSTADATQYRLLDGPALTLHDRGRPVLVGADAQAVPHPDIEAVIFDLDGVLTDTAEAHFQAWSRLAEEHGFSFDREFNENLKGIDRVGSLGLILEHAKVEVDEGAFAAMLVRKNSYYLEAIADFSPAQLYPGVSSLLTECRRAGLKIGLASASRNAAMLIEKLGIARSFDHVTDAATIARGKPDPEIFLQTARALGVAPENCLGVEDASAGIAAIRGAGMVSFGVGREDILSEADRVFADTASIRLRDIIEAERRT